MQYYGFSFPHAFLLGDPEWFERMGVPLVPDAFDPYTNGLHCMFDVLHDVLRGRWIDQGRGGCYMVTRDFVLLLRHLELLDAFSDARGAFEAASNVPFEPILHVSTRNGDFPLQGNYLRNMREELQSCMAIKAKSLVIHLPEVSHDVSAGLIDLFCSSAFIDLVSPTDVTLHIENGLHGEWFGSLRNILHFSHLLSDKLDERGFAPFMTKFTFCLDTGHLLLWRHHHPAGVGKADAEIETALPEFARKTGVLHIKACDAGKEYITPFARDTPLFLEHSQRVMDWLEIINRVRTTCPRYYCMEIPSRNFNIDEIRGFRRRLDGCPASSTG